MLRTALLALLLAVPVAAIADESELKAVRAAVEHYLQGHVTGDGAHFRLAFHPESKLFFIRDGKLAQWTSEEYIGRAKGTPAPDEAERKRRVDFIDIAGDAAVAKLTLDYPEVTFTDYLTLLKVDGEWKIINKTFHADRKKKP